VFTVAITTVVFPSISKLAVKGHFSEFSEEFAHGMRLIFAVTIPAATGLIVLSKPILILLFEWGAFNARDVSLVVPVLVISAIGLPFYSMATLATRGFHALKDTRTPVVIGVCSFALNLGLALWWMQFWGVEGLAAAGVASACFQNISLRIVLIRKQPLIKKGRFWLPLIEVIAAAKIMAVIAWLGMAYGSSLWGTGKWGNLVSVVLVIPVGMMFYLLFLKVFRFQEVYEIRDLFRKVFLPFPRKKRLTQ
jgi:putative peptidoglycan lipid II flippase